MEKSELHPRLLFTVTKPFFLAKISRGLSGLSRWLVDSQRCKFLSFFLDPSMPHGIGRNPKH